MPPNRHGDGSGNGGCFIATAAFDTPQASEIIILKKFREEKLRPYKIGELVIMLYEKISPPIANILREKEEWKAFVRSFIRLLIKLIN